MLTDERQPGGRLVVALDNDVLQQVAQAGLDGSLVPAVDFEEVRHRALLPDMAVGLHEHHARGVAELTAARHQFFHRGETRLDSGQVLLTSADRARAPLVLVACRGEFRFTRRAIEMNTLERDMRTGVSLGRAGAIALDLLDFAAQVVVLHVELAERLADTFTLHRGVFHRVAERGHRVQRAEQLSARRLDVPFKSFDLLLRPAVGLVRLVQDRRRRVTGTRGLSRGIATRLERNSGRLAPRLEVGHLIGNLGRPRRQHRGLMPIELELLLPSIDIELAEVGLLADANGARISLGLLNPQTAAVRFDLRDATRGHGLALTGLAQPGARHLHAVSQLAVPACQQHLFPAAQLLAQRPVASRLRGLPLQRPALPLDLEDDVVDAGEVLLRGIELQLGGPSP